MTADVRWFAPPPGRDELPARMPSPFAADPPHPLARRAIAELLAELGDAPLDAGGGGKMFGVLVVEDAAGRVGALRAFSGMLRGRWFVDGFAPPLFDPIARDRCWPDGEAELAILAQRIADLRDGAEAIALQAERAAQAAQHAAALVELTERHARNRAERHATRARDGGSAALDQASRVDGAERRRLEAAHRAARDALALRSHAPAEALAAAIEARAARSRTLLTQIHDSYVITNARGDRRSLASIYAPDAPPGGAGDCAAPKLIAHAHRLGLRPRALAEVWWGPPPATGGRHAGTYYPACRGKCGPLLPFLLSGEPVDDAPIFGAAPIAADEPQLVYQDAWLVVVDKPVGLLAVPGRHARLRDSVATRLAARYGDAARVVHRLDLDTSGLMIVARDAATHAALQRLFARREIAKRYVAWLDGEVAADAGVIELALRVDLDDRPRQIHDPIHGKAAVTGWRVVARAAGRTRVALEPHTGRTHQLRVHAAHPLGLGAPIVGDRLYGHTAADRLQLHAEALAFTHPHTGARVAIDRPAPF